MNVLLISTERMAKLRDGLAGAFAQKVTVLGYKRQLIIRFWEQISQENLFWVVDRFMQKCTVRDGHILLKEHNAKKPWD